MAKPVGEKCCYDKPDVFQSGVFYHLVWYTDVASERDIVMNVVDPTSLKNIDKRLYKHGETITISSRE